MGGIFYLQLCNIVIFYLSITWIAIGSKFIIVTVDGTESLFSVEFSQFFDLHDAF